MKKIIIALKTRKNEKHRRAALVSSATGFTNCLIVDVDEAVDVYCIDCTHSLEGKSGTTLAKQFLFGKGSRLKNRMTHVPTPYSVKEMSFSVKEIRSEFGRSIAPHNKKVERLTKLL